MNPRISIRAREDLDCIFAYVLARQGSRAADRFLEQAKQAVAFLAKHPEAGPHPSWTARHKTIRFWVISKTNFLIFYFSDESGIGSERVLDGRRDVRRILEEDLEEPRD